MEIAYQFAQQALVFKNPLNFQSKNWFKNPINIASLKEMSILNGDFDGVPVSRLRGGFKRGILECYKEQYPVNDENSQIYDSVIKV